MRNVLLNLKERFKMEDEFIITFLNNKKYRIKDVKKIVRTKKQTTKVFNKKYISKIDEKICKWEIK